VDPSILRELLDAFAVVFTGGLARLSPDAMWLLRQCATIELAVLALWWGLSQDDAVVAFLTKALWFGAFIWLVTAWGPLTQAVVDGFIATGLKAGGGTLTPSAFSDPSAIARYGLEGTRAVWTQMSSFSGWSGLFSLPQMLFAGIAALLAVLCFFLISIHVFIALLEFYLVAALTLILVPFGVWRHTAFLAERAFGAVIAHGVRLMVLACITSAMLPVLGRLTLPAEPDFNHLLSFLLASLALLILSWHAPGVAAGIMAGAPVLTANAAAGAAVGVGGAVTLLGVVGAQLVRGMGQGARQLVTAGSAVHTAVQLHGASGPPQLLKATGQDLWRQTTRGFREAVSSGRIYTETRLQGGNPPLSGPPPASRRGASGAPARFLGVSRYVPPQAHPSGGLTPRLRHPD
jgi:type IV secretion system protein TrbL